MVVSRFAPEAIVGIEPDIIIVGAGPAGLVIASEHLSTEKTVVVLESGGVERSSRLDELNEVEVIGHSRSPQDEVRCRILGGASALWTGRCGMLDDIDFAERPWIPRSGWPFGLDMLRPYYQRAGRYLGIQPTMSAEDAAGVFYQPFDSPQWDREILEPVLWQFSNSRAGHDDLVRQFAAATVDNAEGVGVLLHSGAPVAVNLAAHLKGPLEASKNVHVFTHATASEIEASTVGRVTGVKVATMSGETVSLQAPCIVLACGGIENARLLLASRSTAEAGLGNDRDQVGRYLTDHAFVQAGLYKGAAGVAVRRRMGSRWHPDGNSSEVYCLGMRLGRAAQRREKLLNASMHIVEFGKRENALRSLANALKAAKESPGANTAALLARALARPRGLAESAYDRFFMKRPPLNLPEETVVACVFEQELNPESRVTLSNRTNWLGQPLARIDWRLSEREYQTTKFMTEAFLDELDRLGIERPQRPDWLDGDFDSWKAPLTDLAHPTCATRMSADPGSGVVDENCKVHGVEGLYVAGSSVFATNGHMNPTQTIMALSLRLADHLKSRRAPGEVRKDHRPPLRLGFVGGGHRVATVYGPVVRALGERVEVVGAVTRTEDGAARIAATTGWEAGTDLTSLIEARKPELLVVVVPPDVIDSQYPRYVSLGIPLLLETPFCWNVRAGRKLLKQIGATRGLVGVAENFPFFPEEQLRKMLIESGCLGRVQQVENQCAIYDYHAMAVLRTHLGRDRRPSRAQGIVVEDPRLLRGTVVFEDGVSIAHDYSPYFFDLPFKYEGQIRIIADAGSVSGNNVLFNRDGKTPLKSSFSRIMDGDDLISISLETPDGKLLWSNPYRGKLLNDEQISVAEVLVGMVDAVQNSGIPRYLAVNAFKDAELMASMWFSARRGGRFLNYPPSPLWEALRVRATTGLKKFSSKPKRR